MDIIVRASFIYIEKSYYKIGGYIVYKYKYKDIVGVIEGRVLCEKERSFL